MKKPKLLLFISLIITNLCFAQSGWFWQNPRPTKCNLNSVGILSDQNIFICGISGLALKSSNGGLNWTQSNIFIGRQNTVNDILFFNSNTGLILGSNNNYGNNGFIYRSTNGGNYWQNVYLSSSGILRFIYEDSILYALSSTHILRSFDKGISWLIINNDNNLKGVSFKNLNTGIAVGYKVINIGGFPPSSYNRSLILRTSNAGINWIADSIGNFIPNDVKYLSQNKAILTGSNGKIYESINNGLTWTVSLTETFGFNKIYLKDSLLFVLGNNGLLLRSSNSGVDWLYYSLQGGDPLNNISINNNGIGYTVGNNGSLHKTTNYGYSWQNKKTFFANAVYDWEFFNAIHFLNTNTGVAVCEYFYGPSYFKTTNGGLNWISYNNNGLYNLNKNIFMLNKDTIFTTSTNGTYNKTINGGINWTRYSIPNYYSELHGITFINGSTGFICGWNGLIAKSTNIGITWLTQNLGNNYNFEDIDFYHDSTGVAVGANQGGVIVWSTDCGTTWLIRNSGLNTYTSFNGVSLINKFTAIIADRDGRILRTTNSGINWSIVVQYLGTLSDIVFRDSLNGIVVGNNGLIMKTTNAGLNWAEAQSNTNYNITCAAAKGATDFTVGGVYLTLLSTSENYPIGINIISNNLPCKSALDQNYPNPFNPQTKIKFDIPANVKGQTTKVKLIIYDLLGREVTTLVNEELNPGTYEVDWDGSNYSSGVYFYKLGAGDFTETKKMVLMK